MVITSDLDFQLILLEEPFRLCAPAVLAVRNRPNNKTNSAMRDVPWVANVLFMLKDKNE
jgi:hypothetical protein